MPRTYQPRSYPFVDMPAPHDPVQSVSSLMNLGSNLQQFSEQQRQAKQEKAVETALAKAQGDLGKAATFLEEQGEWTLARNFRDNAQQIREQTVTAIGQRLSQHQTIYGQSAQYLKELEARPELYPDLRPKLVEMATALDPRLAQEIPETYDPETVRGMIQFVEGGAVQTDARLRAVAAAEARLKAKQGAVKDLTTDRQIAGEWFSVSANQEDWDMSVQGARTLGISENVLAHIGERWSVEAQEKARQLALTPEQRGKANEPPPAGSTEDVYRSYARDVLKKPYAAMSIRDKANAERWWSTASQASTARDTEWVMRDGAVVQIPKGTARAGDAPYDATAVRQQSLTPTREARATAERFKVNELQALEREYRQSQEEFEPMTADALNRRKLDIENAYRRSIGLDPLTQLPREWDVSRSSSSSAAPPPPPQAPSITDFAVTAKADGTVTVTAPDGSTADFKTHAEATAAIQKFLAQSRK